MRFNLLNCHRDALSKLLQEAVLCKHELIMGVGVEQEEEAYIRADRLAKAKREKEEAKEEKMVSEQIEKVKCLRKMNETSNESN